MREMTLIIIGLLLGVTLMGWLRATREWRRGRPWRRERNHRANRAASQAHLETRLMAQVVRDEA